MQHAPVIGTRSVAAWALRTRVSVARKQLEMRAASSAAAGVCHDRENQQ